MDFTRLNLKTYRLDEGVATGNNAIEGESKATANSLENSKPKQMDPRRREAQLNQRTARVGTPTTTQSIVSSYDYFADLRDKKQALNMFENSKCDWRKEIQEAANPDDDPNHPYVEIMPSTSFKAKEAEQNVKKGVVKQKMAGSGPGRAGLDEELLVEDELQEAIPALVGIAAKGAGALAGGAVKGAAATAGLATKGVKGAITKAAVGHAARKASEKAETKVNDMMSSDTERAVEEEYISEAKKKEEKLLTKSSKSPKVRKAAAELDKLNKESEKYAKKAKTEYKNVKRLSKKGDKKGAIKSNMKGHSYSQKSKSLRAKGMKYVPVGSTTYSNTTGSGMNNKFKRDLKTNSGRLDIVSRTLGEDSKQLSFDGLVDDMRGIKSRKKDDDFKKAKDGIANKFTYGKKHEDYSFDEIWAMIEETSPGDYQDTPGKIKSGKILNTKPGVDNFDRTATPKENIARRKVNKNPEIRGKMGKKLVKQVETDAFSDK